ncbi:hypothetical protein [Flavobacterium sp. 2]|uniref:hypothetical protein n=1 Tax=Flavobacterium sp. 2 TaxID=308053 RepID=UPI003CE7CB1D
MSTISFLTKAEYVNHVQGLEDGHWTNDTIEIRWDYHSRVIELVKATGVDYSNKVLEMGTMGVSCVKESHTIDYLERWDFEGKNPNYPHDAREIPWPVNDKQYEVFIALRVFQHLTPVQPQAVLEAFRIAKKIILVIPEKYDNPIIPGSKGISYEDFYSILGVHPNLYFPTAFGSFFYWDSENPSSLDLSKVMANIKLTQVTKQVIQKEHSHSIKTKVKSKIKRLLKKLK